MAAVPLSEWTQTAPTLIPVEEYLRTSYRPDCDYVDRIIEERNVGEFEHGRLQVNSATIFRNHEREWNAVAVTECRLQVGSNRYRIPDLLVLRDTQKVSRIVREPPSSASRFSAPAIHGRRCANA